MLNKAVLGFLLLLSLFTISSNGYDDYYKLSVTQIGTQRFDGDVQVQVRSPFIVIYGCKVSAAKYVNDDNGYFKAENFVSTGAKCQDQSEDLLIAAFGQAAKIQEQGSSFILKDANGKITVVLSSSNNVAPPVQPPVPPPVLPPVVPNDKIYISGAYELKVEGFDEAKFKATFFKEYVNIEGCNSHRIPYQAFKTGKIQFGQGLSTLKFCSDDKDSLFLNALKQVVFYSQINNLGQIFLQNQKFTQLIKLTRSKVLPENYIFPQNLNYILKSNNFSKTQLTLKFENNTFVVEGCNIHSLRYRADVSGKIEIVEGMSTRRACVVDYDSQFISQLVSVKRYIVSPIGFAFFSSDDTSLTPVLEAIEQPLVEPQVPTSLAGDYILQDSGVILEIKDNKFSFTGVCNSHTFSYQAYPTSPSQHGSPIQFGPVTSTLQFCEGDYDGTLLTAIKKSTHFEIDDSQTSIIFFDEYHDRTIVLVVWLSVFPTYGYIDGSYKLTLAKNFIDMRINDQSITISGCNTHTFNYNALTNGDISFSKQIMSTQKACLEDFDQIFIQSVIRANTFLRENNLIYFIANSDFDGDEQIGVAKVKPAQLIRFVSSGSDEDKEKASLTAGEYTIRILQSNLDVLPAKITEDTISFIGCNNVSFKYEAFTDGTIEVQQGISTLKACQKDYDSYYTNALLQTQYYLTNDARRHIFYNSRKKSRLQFTPIGNSS